MTIHQIKAARALLDWTQADLAKAAGIHLNVINNIERGTSSPRQNTLDRVQAALEGSGIAFLGARGVELKRETVAVTKHEGPHFIRGFTADILSAAGAQEEVLSILSDIRNFSAHDPDGTKDYYAQKTARGFQERLITRDMPGFYPRHSETYRVVAPELLGPVDMVIYADRVAHLFWGANEVIIMKNPDLAATQRRIFEHLWAAGHEPRRSSRAAED